MADSNRSSKCHYPFLCVPQTKWIFTVESQKKKQYYMRYGNYMELKSNFSDHGEIVLSMAALTPLWQSRTTTPKIMGPIPRMPLIWPSPDRLAYTSSTTKTSSRSLWNSEWQCAWILDDRSLVAMGHVTLNTCEAMGRAFFSLLPPNG